MAKGFFTQGTAVLLSGQASLDELEPLLRSFRVVKRDDRGVDSDLSGPSLLVAFRPEVNGYVTVDVQNRRWPDHMGDPKNETGLFGAWSMAHFGPFAFPGGLQRAGEQSWSWEAGKTIPAAHRAFIRVRLSYLFGADDDALVRPKDCEPVAELQFVTAMARALLDHSAALAYFNPSGEVLRSRELMDRTLEGCARLEVPATNLWCNVRLFNLPDRWLLMDSVGMQQFDRRDSEACFRADAYEPDEVDHFIRNVGLYLIDSGDVIADGDTMDGPGDVRWRAARVENSAVAPPRAVLRWFPLDGSPPPPELAR